MPAASSRFRFLAPLSLKSKLAAIVLLASGFALFVASVVAVFVDRIAARDALERDTGILADMIAATSTAAVAFSSKDDAKEILDALRFRSNVESAYIVNADHDVFARYPDNDSIVNPPRSDLSAPDQWLSDKGLHLSRPIVLNGRRIGTLILTVNTSELGERLIRWAKTIALVWCLALLIAFLVTSELQKIISRPIGNLVDVANRVSKSRDYSLRAVPGNEDEVGSLILSFNEMLSQISQRDEELREVHDTLERRVHDRTRALKAENEERERAEKALETQRAFLRHVIDTDPSLIFVKDREGRFELINQAVADVYGTTVESLIGKTDADFNPNEEEVRAFRRDDLDVMDNLKEKFIPEEPITDAMGRLRWLQTIKRPLIASDGTCNQILGVAADITARKEAESALRSSEEQLRQAIKMEAIGRLAGGIAHDFNNLLAVIMGRSELLAAMLESEHKLFDTVQEIDLAAQKAASLTRQLLAFSRRQVLEPKPLNLNDAVVSMEKMLRRLIGENIECASELDPSPHLVMADPGQVEQVIMNLVINARDAITHSGRITIRTGNVSLPETQLSGDAGVPPGTYAFVSVSDTGSGMDEQTRSRIFEPFFTTKEPGKGTGLGLSTVYGIINQSGGHIDVRSQVGVGTTFTVYLPRAEVPACSELKPEVSDSKVMRGSGETILLVEDEDGVRELVRHTLILAGYRVLSAGHGLAAIELSESHRGSIELVISDVMMPGFSGPETVKRLLMKRPQLRVIYMSGYAEAGTIMDDILGMGCTLLQKPFRLDELRGIVGRTLCKIHVGNAE